MGVQWEPVRKGRWSEAEYWLARAGAPGIDAYLVWADATGFADIRRSGDAIAWVPLLVELKAGKTAAELADAVSTPAFRKWIRVPEVYRNPSVAALRRVRYCTVAVTRTFFDHLSEPKLQEYVERFELGLPAVAPVAGDAPAPMPRPASNGPVVVIGTIDDNFAFAHARFRERGAATTRIDYLWTQDPSAQRVPGLDYGREIEGSAINGWLGKATRAGTVNEDEVYGRARYADAQKRLAHGTHVMDIAAGENPAHVGDAAPRLVCVQFPSRDNWGAMPLGVQVLDALRYIIDRADRIAGYDARKAGNTAAHVVVNLPHANLAGPHDGSSILECAMDDLIERRREAGSAMEIVLPAGNNYLSRGHARFEVGPGNDAVMQWRILPDDATPNFLEIWLPDEAARDAVAVQVTPPGNRESEPIASDQVVALRNDQEEILCTVVYLARAANGARPMILLAVAPTSTHRRKHGGTPAPGGVWKVRVSARTGPFTIDAWIQRDDPVLGKLPYGRQSRFDHADYVRFEQPYGRPRETDLPQCCPVKRAGSINAIATGRKTVVIGGFRRSDGAAARYSGSGRATVGASGAVPALPAIRGPDAMGVSDDSHANRGVLGAGVRSGCTVAMDGTSVAVARMAGYIAEELQRTGTWTMPAARTPGAGTPTDGVGRAAVVGLAKASEAPPGFSKPKPSVERGGAGRAGLPPRLKR